MGYHKATGNSVVEDPKISQIYDLLINGIPKKEVANKCSVPLDLVYTVSKRYKTNQVKYRMEETKSEEVQEMEVVEVEKRKKRSNKKLSDDVILQIWELYSNGTSLPRISEIVGASYSSVRKYALEYKASYENENVEEPETEPEQQPELNLVAVNKNIEQDNTPILRKIRCDAYLICGLVDGRHDMPTKKYIFDSVSKSDMFNYKFQEEKCRNFITEIFHLLMELRQKVLWYMIQGYNAYLQHL